MKKMFLFLAVISVAQFLSAEISKNAEKSVSDFKVSVYQSKSQDAVLARLDDFLKSSENQNFSEEEKAVIKNTALIVKLDFTQTKENQKALSGELSKRNQENKILIEKSQNLGKYFYASTADVQSRLLNFVSGGAMYKLSMSSKEFYKKALSIDKNFSEGHRGYGLWLLFAPRIAGGGAKAALKEMNQAVKTANTKIDSYLALIYRSQVFFKMGKKDKCEEDLKAAEKVFPNGNLVKSVREENAKGNTLFN